MRPKRTKIRRYGNIYQEKTGGASWYIILSMLAGVVIFGLIGWGLYTPIHQWLLNLDRPPESEAVIDPAGDESSAVSVAPTPAPTPPQPTQTPHPKMQGLFLPGGIIENPVLLSGVLAQAGDFGLNTVVAEAKDATGQVLYSSQLPSAKLAASAATYDARVLAGQIKAAGFRPAARIHAFRDATMSLIDTDLAVSYYNTKTLWLDNSPAQGGKAWLNPCAPGAQDYIIALAQELVSSGFETIVIDSVQFPVGFSLEKAGYGVEDPDRAQVLDDFLAALKSGVEQRGGDLVICWPMEAVEGTDEALRMIYGGNPVRRREATMLLALSNNPQEARGQLALAKGASPKSEWLGLIPAYGSDGSLLDVNALLTEIQPDGYMLYNPQGNYRLEK